MSAGAHGGVGSSGAIVRGGCELPERGAGI